MLQRPNLHRGACEAPQRERDVVEHMAERARLSGGLHAPCYLAGVTAL